MSASVKKILENKNLQFDEIKTLLRLRPPANLILLNKALDIKSKTVGRKVYLRGLIEYSNRCAKNCYYCGIRSENKQCQRYQMADNEVIDAAKFAYQNRFASIVIQSGEDSSIRFISTIEYLLGEIRKLTNGELHITLSLGEQSRETYQRWFDAGAHRYLLRIETSNPVLYKKLHPSDKLHDFNHRLDTLKILREVGYQVGTGVMIGLPFQTIDDLAEDLLFFRKIDVDMVGMGPYIEHEETPLFEFSDTLLPLKERLEISLNMVAVLRIMMKNINIAATTAMQTIDPQGRERALLAGANVMMPNLTPAKYRDSYLLYKDKSGVADDASGSKNAMEESILLAGETIGYGEWGDSQHYELRTTNYATKKKRTPRI